MPALSLVPNTEKDREAMERQPWAKAVHGTGCVFPTLPPVVEAIWVLTTWEFERLFLCPLRIPAVLTHSRILCPDCRLPGAPTTQSVFCPRE
jgi:hypothetical protein